MAKGKTAEELVAQVDTGGRNLSGGMARLIPTICFVWALYQLYIASPIPSMLTTGTGIDFFYFVGNLSISRKIHLAFAVVLASLAYPLLASSPRNRIPWYDWILAATAAAAARSRAAITAWKLAVEAVSWMIPTHSEGRPSRRPSQPSVTCPSSASAGDELHRRPMLFSAAPRASARTPGLDPPAAK